MTSPTIAPRSEARVTADHGTWRTVVWDDPINLMSYVARVFREHFGYSSDKAHALMMEVHVNGSATVSVGTREHMEADVLAMHGYGLRATLEAGNQ